VRLVALLSHSLPSHTASQQGFGHERLNVPTQPFHHGLMRSHTALGGQLHPTHLRLQVSDTRGHEKAVLTLVLD
jgi:hypothetical protein